MRHEQTFFAIHLLGPPRLERDGKVIEVDTRKAIALLAYLALHNERFSRDRLATFLWPEYDQARAYANLRRTLWSLNKAVGEGWIRADHEVIGLEARQGCWVDVSQFREYLTQCRAHGHARTEVCAACLEPLTQAAALVRGDFLEGFSLRDSLDFDDWQALQSATLRQEVSTVLERLVMALNGAGTHEAALVYAQRWVALDPLHEPAQRQLMLTYAWAGQAAAALQQYRKCEQVLKEEMDVPPEAETTHLFEAIRTRQTPAPPLRADLQLGSTATHPSTSVNSVADQPAMQPPIQLTPTIPTTVSFNHLPSQSTSFVGRQAEIAEIRRLLLDEAACCLLTLLGPGGIGKTRLALQAAQTILDLDQNKAALPANSKSHPEARLEGNRFQARPNPKFTNGVCFVALAGVDAPALLASALTGALQLPLIGGLDPKQQLFDYLREKQALLVLDNFEQLVEGAAFLVELLEAAPAVKILLTSRQRLNLSEEWLLVVPGLELPQAGAIQAVDASSAVQLFYERARRVQRAFTPAAEEPHVIRICQWLGGMPLAIELAAAWTRSLACAEIAQEIQQNLDFLTTTLRNVPDRQRSLRAIFGQSWQMLTPVEQSIFAALTVFRGGFERAAAERVAGATLSVLRTLADKSFVQHNQAAGRGRYAIHEGLRQFGIEKLPQAAAVQARHAQYFADFLEHRYPDLVNGEPDTIRETEREIDNIRTAWEWAITQVDVAILGKAVKGLASYYELRGWFRDGEQLFARAAQALTGQTLQAEIGQLVLAQLRERQGWFKALLGENQLARTLIEDSLRMFRQAEADLEAASALAHLGVVLSTVGDNAQAQQVVQESMTLFQALDNMRGKAMTLQYLGLIASRLGHDEEATHHLQESTTLWKLLNNRRDLAKTLKELGNIYTGLGDYPEAKRLYEESRTIFQEIGELAGAVACLLNLGLVALRMSEYIEAERFNTHSLALLTQLGEQRGMAIALNNLGEVARLRGDFSQAQQHFEKALALHRTTGYRQGAALSLYHLGCLMNDRNDSQARYYFADALQIAANLQLVWLILFFCPGLAVYLARYGEPEFAVEILSLALHYPEADTFAQSYAEAILEDVVATLSSEVAARAEERGQRRDIVTTLAELREKFEKNQKPID